MLCVASTFSWAILLLLLFILAVSIGMFCILALRDTTYRRRLALSEWASARSFQLFKKGQADLPEPLAGLQALRPVVCLALAGGESMILHVQTDPPPQRRVGPIADHWRLLIRHSGGDWRPAGLRPAHHPDSLLDRLGLQSCPAAGTDPDRFMPVAADARAAGVLAHSPARTLLPPDVGLLLRGAYLIVDFSARPFDPIEFDRMLAISAQLVTQLPAVVGNER
jgi:hypothetical protein